MRPWHVERIARLGALTMSHDPYAGHGGRQPNPRFASDNAGTVHPAVLQAIHQANHGAALAYGADPWTTSATADIREALGMPEAAVLPCFGGTGTNILALRVLASRIESVLCADAAHLVAAETAAPQVTAGVQLILVPTIEGKMTPEALRSAMPARLGIHRPRPAVLSVTQATEFGTVYTIDELQGLTETAHELGLRVHLDGARLFHAAHSLDCSLAALTGEIGIDAVSLSGTKNGMLFAEALVVRDPTLAEDAGYHRKQITQLASKMRFLSCQFSAVLRHNLWRDIARQAMDNANHLAAAVAHLPGVHLEQKVETNAVFARLPRAAALALQQQWAFALWRDYGDTVVARWMTSYEVTTHEIDQFVEDLKAAL